MQSSERGRRWARPRKEEGGGGGGGGSAATDTKQVSVE